MLLELSLWWYCAIVCLLAEVQAQVQVPPAPSPSGCTGTTTISAAAAATESLLVTSCSTYDGDIIVDLTPSPTNTTSPTQRLIVGSPTPLPISAIAGKLPGTIAGTLEFRNGKVDSAEAVVEGLQAQCFSFNNITFTTDVADFPYAKALVPMPSLNFTNTNLSHIYAEGNDLALNSTSARLNITAIDNLDLLSLSVTGLSKILTNIDIRQNNPNMTVSLPDLRNATVRVSNVTALSANLVQSVSTNQMGFLDTPQFVSGGSFSNLSFSNLTTMQSIMQIENNLRLGSLDLSSLQSAVGLQVLNNPNLTHLDLPVLNNVSMLEISGPMQLQIPQLQSKQTGVAQLSDTTLNAGEMLNCSTGTQSSPPILDCRIQTASAAANTTGTGGSGDGAEPSAVAPSHSGLSKGAKIGIGVGVGLGLAILLLAGALFFLSRLKRKRRAQRESTRGEYSKADLDAGPHGSPVSTQRESKNIMQVNGGGIAAGEEVEDSRQRPVSAMLDGDARERPRSHAAPVELEEQQGERYEMEEQQGVRHEMDARSLQDIEIGGDDDPETRSLDDIERTHVKE